MSESTIKREAFFLEFSKKIKSELKKIIVYLTGGFRTVPGMVKAVEENATDGIGLGRPVTSEIGKKNLHFHIWILFFSDLPAKILSGKVQSAIFNPFEKDFGIGNTLSNLQMWQAQQTPFTTIERINENILDPSDEKQVELFKENLNKYVEELTKLAAEGIPVHGTLQMMINNVKNSSIPTST